MVAMDAYQDATRRGVAGRARLQEHPFVIALEECSTTPVLGANDVVSEFLSTHNKLDVPINLQVLNGRSRRIRDLEVKYLPSEDETLQRIYRHSGSSVNWFRRPYAKVYLVCCDNLADYKKRARPRLRELIEKNDRLRPGGGGDGDHALSGSSGSAANPLIQLTPWLVLYLQGASNTPQTQQQHKKVFQMIKDDFNSSKYSSTAMYYNSASTGAASGAGLGGNPMAATAHKGKADRVCQLVIKPGNAVDGEWDRPAGQLILRLAEPSISRVPCPDTRNPTSVSLHSNSSHNSSRCFLFFTQICNRVGGPEPAFGRLRQDLIRVQARRLPQRGQEPCVAPPHSRLEL